MKKYIHNGLIIFVLFIAAQTTYGQSSVSAKDILNDVRDGKDITFKNVRIVGDLGLTYYFEKKHKEKYSGKKSWFGNDNNVVEEIVNSRIIFENCTFEGKSAFKYSDFDGKADFWESTFNEEALFKYAKFRESADFGGAFFDDDANFKYAKFRRGLNFSYTTFDRDLNIKYAKIDGDFSSSKMKVRDDLDVKYAKVNGESFSKILIERGFTGVS